MTSSLARYDPENPMILISHAQKNENFTGTIEDIAILFSVTPRTISRWLQKYDKFREARQKVVSNSDISIENALYMSAIGYDCIEKTTTRTLDDGSVERITEKHIPPNIAAARFWLTNRSPDKWKLDIKLSHEGSLTVCDERADKELAEILAAAEAYAAQECESVDGSIEANINED